MYFTCILIFIYVFPMYISCFSHVFSMYLNYMEIHEIHMRYTCRIHRKYIVFSSYLENTCGIHVKYMIDMYFSCTSHVYLMYFTCISHVFGPHRLNIKSKKLNFRQNMYIPCIFHVFYENMYFPCILWKHVFPMYFMKTCISHVFYENMYFPCILWKHVFPMYFHFWTLFFMHAWEIHESPL
jgi:hypothetical protein